MASSASCGASPVYNIYVIPSTQLRPFNDSCVVLRDDGVDRYGKPLRSSGILTRFECVPHARCTPILRETRSQVSQSSAHLPSPMPTRERLSAEAAAGRGSFFRIQTAVCRLQQRFRSPRLSDPIARLPEIGWGFRYRALEMLGAFCEAAASRVPLDARDVPPKRRTTPPRTHHVRSSGGVPPNRPNRAREVAP